MGIDVTDFVLVVEETLDVEIPDEVWWQFVTVGDLCDYIVQKKPGVKRGDVIETVRQIAVRELALGPQQVQLTSRWIDDLKLD